MITVAVIGCMGRMGQAVVSAVTEAEDMTLVCGVDPAASDACEFPVYATVEEALQKESFQVMVDFTQPSVVESHIRACLPAHVHCVIGTTGLSDETLAELSELCPEDTCLFVAPNFTIGAVLMMEFAKTAAKFFPEAEVVEYHHCNKKDAPSGTATRTAALIAENRDFESTAPGSETEIPGAEGARGALIKGVPVHSIRSMGYVASQEVIFGSMGQTLTIRHDSWDRFSYMPGVLLAVRAMSRSHGLIVGLENLMD
ncbi:MAG: 4-hydroxy-tetrahydrodipicolinate reductase [Eggerthellales bacterium]|nr:4-hydroxy-tetrahydrodipicolinate reductase [Eggerthellales bacterium]